MTEQKTERQGRVRYCTSRCNFGGLWRDYPCLYDVRSLDCKDRDMRENGHHEIVEKLQNTVKI